jgi:FixJ family two-component response regulator
MQVATTSPRVAPSFTTKGSHFAFYGPLQFRADAGTERDIVYIVDDDIRVREALSELLASLGRTAITFGTAAEYLAANRADTPSCLILDMLLPDMSGLELQRRLLHEDCPPIIFISGRADIPSTVCAMKAGAVEFLTKPVCSYALEAAIESALRQDRERRRRRSELKLLQTRFESLTPREREVLPLVARGLLNKQAAAALGITDVTLQVHRSQVMRKMAAGSFAELVRMAERLGIPASD